MSPELRSRHGESGTISSLLTLPAREAIAFDHASWQRLIIDDVNAHATALMIVGPVRASTVALDQGPKELQPFRDFARIVKRETGVPLQLGHHDTKPKDGQPDRRTRPQRASGGAIFSIIDSPSRSLSASGLEGSAPRSRSHPFPIAVKSLRSRNGNCRG